MQSAGGPAPQMADKLAALVPFCHHVLDITGEIIRDNERKGRRFEIKADRSPVTEVDRQVEQTVRKLIAEFHPEHGVLGEEFAPTDLDRDLVWVIDPIDGTKPFIGGIPVYGTLLALTLHGVPVRRA